MYKIYMRKIQNSDIKEQVNKSMFTDRKTQCCQDVSSLQFDIYIQCSSSKSFSELFCGYQQSYSKIYTERQKIQNRQLNIEGGRTKSED